MIVPMYKYAFLVYHSAYKDFLKNIREIGVVHISTKTEEPTPEMQELFRHLNEVDKAAKKLEAKKQPLRASQYYAAFADTRSKMPSGKDAVAMDAYDKAAKLAREAGSKAQADIYEQKAYNLCLKVHGKESAEAQKRKNALDSKFTSK